MFASITCPTCRHKLSIPEGTMGNRINCPNCQAPFVAGKSVAAGAAAAAGAAVKSQPFAEPPGINKTMLASTDPPIKYNCPRCKKPLESPSIEAGTKKPCPECGQRLQVPAAPPPAVVPAGLNKTMLAGDDSYPQPAGIKHPPSYSAAPPAPMGPNVGPVPQVAGGLSGWSGSQKTLAVIGIVIAGLIALSLLTGPSSAERERYANAQRELEKLKMEMEHGKALLDKQKQFEAEMQRRSDQMMAEIKAKQERLDFERELDRKNQAYLADTNLAAAAKAKRDREQADIDRLNKEAENNRKQEAADMRAKMEALQKQVDAAKQQSTTIIQAAPPPVYYPWHRGYYWPY